MKDGVRNFEAVAGRTIGKIIGKAKPHQGEIPKGLRPLAASHEMIPPGMRAVDFDTNDVDWGELPWMWEDGPFIVDLKTNEFDHRLLGGRNLTTNWDNASGEKVDGWEEESGGIIGGLIGSGTDTLAFYKSIRNVELEPFPGKWGIFYFDYGIKFVGEAFADYSSKRISFKRRYRVGLELLRLHELYHFKVDAWSMVMEASARKPLYQRYKSKKDMLRSISSGAYYEESLANRFARGNLKNPEIREFFEHFVSFHQPSEYQLNLAGGETSFNFPDAGTASLVADVLMRGGKNWNGCGASDMFGAEMLLVLPDYFNDYPQFHVCPHPSFVSVWGVDSCPEYLIAGLSVTDALGDAFKALPSRKEFLKFLKSYLSAEPDSRTDHEFWRLDNREKLKIPNPHSKTIKTWEFTNTLRKAGMQLSDYSAARKDTAVWKRNCPRPNPVPSIA